MRVEHHDDADDLVRKATEFRRKGRDEPRAVRLRMFLEAARVYHFEDVAVARFILHLVKWMFMRHSTGTEE